jgi:hypothetical protein
LKRLRWIGKTLVNPIKRKREKTQINKIIDFEKGDIKTDAIKFR